MRAAALLLLLLSSCSPEEPADFVFVNGPEPETLDPALATGLPEMRLISALFEGLVTLDPRDLSPRPGAAEGWRRGSAGTWTFRIREDARWSDGRPVTAGDFAWSLARLLDPATGSQYASLYGIIDRIQPLDDRTLLIGLERNCPWFLELLALPPAFPVRRDVVETHGDGWARAGRLVGNGPYRLREWSLGRRIRLEHNPRYRAEAASRVIDALTVESTATGFNLYETGAADLIVSLPAPLIPLLSGRDDFHASPALATTFLRFNVTRPPLRDPRVRRALSLAIERADLTGRIARGGELPSGSLVPPGVSGFEPLPGTADPEEAARLLAEAGYPGGKGMAPIELLLPTGGLQKDLCEVIAARWKERLGVSTRIANREWKACLAAMKALEYDVAYSNWVGDYAHAGTFLEVFRSGSGTNRTGWASSEYDRLLDQGEGALRAAHDLLLREAPIAPLFHPVFSACYRPGVEGIFPNPRNWIDLRGVRAAERGTE